ncbi:hypothetical protein HRbin40_00845 [bacterium HR40]|nr:hypothetical protein HRbin40_00845 [bacterium HR40]
MVVHGVTHFERLFRQAASLDIDKADVRRLSDYVHRKLHDMLVVGVAHAKANGRDVIEAWDLPVTKGLQERLHEFRHLGVAVGLQPVLENLARLPPLELAPSAELEAQLPELVGALTIAVAKTFKVLDPELKNPQSEHWDRLEQLLDVLW